ncbi:SHOCT domain-containing protein [bacterium]|nr:MAG: SHOCT domain-containing protein [bacterium]
MIGSEFGLFSLWWLFPLIMIVLCFLMMRGKGFMCCLGSHERDSQSLESAREILDKRYANGEIDRREYKEKKEDLDRKSEFFHQKEVSNQ